MNTANSHTEYRPDIDGLRSIAVIAVYFFHCGLLPNGYLGVDVFFAISGYLITSILYRETTAGNFSLVNFYHRRIRRIIPLCLFVSTVALSLGCLTMLPDDLENLSQSVIATNLFSNNILQAITTKNYWDVINEFKPLMHTWSLGLEEQYYAVFPFLFLLLGKPRLTRALPIILFLTIASFTSNLPSHFKDHEKFFYLPFRFWELSSGGLLAAYTFRKPNWKAANKTSTAALLILACTLFSPKDLLPIPFLILAAVICSLFILAPQSNSSNFTPAILSNPAAVFIGKISYSIYMWHQIFLAFSRYLVTNDIGIFYSLKLLLLIIFVSTLSFYLIEQPFRSPKRIGTPTLLKTLIPFYAVTLATAFSIYNISGVIRDVPELELTRGNVTRGKHSQYNGAIYSLDKPFMTSSKIKVLVVGNSFGRDWCNILLESEYSKLLDITYAFSPRQGVEFTNRIAEADIVFWSMPNPQEVEDSGVNREKLWVVGTKNFGVCSGYFYNRKDAGYFAQRTPLQDGIFEENQSAKRIWQDRYIDLLEPIIDSNNEVPVFTPDGKFISQDTRHLTAAGARFYARIFTRKVKEIIDEVRERVQ